MNTLAALKSWFLMIIIFMISCSSTLSQSKSPKPNKLIPCNQLILYTHDILFQGANLKNATSAVVTQPSPLSLAKEFGKMVVFNDPVTEDNHLLSVPVAQSQGFFFYNGIQDYNAWTAFTLVFNSTKHKGTLTIMRADIITQTAGRDLSVVGGTGDFFMARGVCTVKTNETDRVYYFRLKLDIKLYECY